jgi:hypothetical protein
MVTDTFTLVSATILPIALLYVSYPPAQNNMLTYFNNQVIGSINNAQTVNSRFAIIGVFIESTILPLTIGCIAIIAALIKRAEKKLFTENLKDSLIFFLVVLSGILPIMISMKQRSFYILTVYPLFAIGLAYYLYPILQPAIKKIEAKTKGFRAFRITTLVVFALSILLSFLQIDRIGRDKTMINDTRTLISVIGRDKSINICPDLYTNWSLHGYFSRYGNVSLIPDISNSCQFYLTTKECGEAPLIKSYELVPVKTEEYLLYRLID